MNAGKLVSMCLGVVYVFGFATIANAQDRPNLSGDWLSADGSVRLRIDVDPARFSVTELVGDRERLLVYRLDGLDSYNETHTVTGELWTHLAQARWVDNAVLITTETTRSDVDASWEWIKIYHLTSSDKLSVTLVDKPLGMPDAMVQKTTKYDRQ